jgi:hypothetical protein
MVDLRIDDRIEIVAEEKMEESVKIEAVTLEDAHMPALPQHFEDMLGVLLGGVSLPLNFDEKSVEIPDGHLPAALRVLVEQIFDVPGRALGVRFELAGEANAYPIAPHSLRVRFCT